MEARVALSKIRFGSSGLPNSSGLPIQIPNSRNRTCWELVKNSVPNSGGKHPHLVQKQVQKCAQNFVPNSVRNVSAGIVQEREIEMTNKDADPDELFVKLGGDDREWMEKQASKDLEEGFTKMIEKLARFEPSQCTSISPLFSPSVQVDVVVIGCGPAGLSIAADVAKHNLSTLLIAPDVPFTNTYGVWVEEFDALGLSHCIDQIWEDTVLLLRERSETVSESSEPALHVRRSYGRVGRNKLRDELINKCVKSGVLYLPATVNTLQDKIETVEIKNNRQFSLPYHSVLCSDGSEINARLVIIATGASSEKFLKFEHSVEKYEKLGSSVQTAYGIEAEIEYLGDGPGFDPQQMIFMDYRNWRKDEGEKDKEKEKDKFSALPTFLYAMPTTKDKIFFEETCLAARPAMPFSELKRRLSERLEKLNVRVKRVLEEEWSYIPVGGSLPDTSQSVVGFGAAASLQHPASGYSITKSLQESAPFAAAIAKALKRQENRLGGDSTEGSGQHPGVEAWSYLWSPERKRQRSFLVFGLELILKMDLTQMKTFFETFFELPPWLWKGFLASSLTSSELLLFAFTVFLVAPNSLRILLLSHFFTHPSGRKMVNKYASTLVQEIFESGNKRKNI